MDFRSDWQPDQVEVTIAYPCPDCGGTGEAKRTPCPKCLGKGRMRESRNLRELLQQLSVRFEAKRD